MTVAANYQCLSFFFVFLFYVILISILMILYHYYRKKAGVKLEFYSYYYIFLFIMVWIAFRVIYYTDAIINYGYDLLITLRQMPFIFSLICISILTYNA